MSDAVVAWAGYVRRVIGDDTQLAAAERTGVDQTTISRWLSAERRQQPPNVWTVGKFARGYGRSVVEAFVAARLITAADAGIDTTQLYASLVEITDEELLREVARRLGHR